MTYRWPSVEELIDLAIDQADTSARVDRLLERVLLGAVLVADVIEQVWFLLGPGDFYDTLHATIWAACLRLRGAHIVELANVARAVEHIPGAIDRVLELARLSIASDGHPTVVMRCAVEIKRAAAHRAAASVGSRRAA